MNYHPQSFRAYAYLIKNELTGAGYSDDSRLSIHLIEGEMGVQLGMVLAAEEIKTARLGGTPDYTRFQDMTVVLVPRPGDSADSLYREGVIDNVLIYNGWPCIASMGTGVVNFTPVLYFWQMPARQSQSRKPVFTLENGKAVVLLTPETVLLQEVQVKGIPANPIPADQDSEWFWKQEWAVPLHVRELVKDAVIRILMPTYWQSKALADQRNNGNEQ